MSARMMHRRGFGTALLAAGLAAPGLGRAAIIDPGGDASRIRVLPDPVEIGPPPYTPPADLKTVLDIYKRMTGPVTINGAGPFPFVADTGANQSVISAELAATLALPAGDSQELNGVAGVQMTSTVTAKWSGRKCHHCPAMLRVSDSTRPRLLHVLAHAGLGFLLSLADHAENGFFFRVESLYYVILNN